MPSNAPLLFEPEHQSWLRTQALEQYAFFKKSLMPDGRFAVLDYDGTPLTSDLQELHTTTRMVHSYALGLPLGADGAAEVIDRGMSYLWTHHRDTDHGGYLWGITSDGIGDDRKLAYGHAFVLLAASSAKIAGHPDADRLLDDVWQVLVERYWEEDHGLFADEFNRDWSPMSTYRGMNANMHSVEALLTAYEATGERDFLDRAGRILDFFVYQTAPQHGWRLPEHYTETWQVDPDYDGNPMFRPGGTTPGHSFELSRLMLQYWDLVGRPEGDHIKVARRLLDQALNDAWHAELGGFVYTLNFDGSWRRADRYWWPVTEAIGTLAAFQKLAPSTEDDAWYRKLWDHAKAHLIDPENGGWLPELDETNQPTGHQFEGKPDIYHSVQAAVFPLSGRLSRIAEDLS